MAFKKFCRQLVSNLVDLLPDEQIKQCTVKLLEEIVKMSNCKMRLFRHGFTQIGMMFFNEFLLEASKLQSLKSYFSGQADVEKKRLSSIDEAI